MSFFTTSNPKLWFTIIGATAFLCCCCGIGLLMTAGRAGEEFAWLGKAMAAAEQATVPRAEQMAVIREIQAGEPLDQGRLDRLAQTAAAMAEQTRKAGQDLQAAPAPERFADLRKQFDDGAKSMENYWTALSGHVQRRDLASVRRTLAEMQAFGDRFRDDLRTEMNRLYGASPAPPSTGPAASDPARP